ncbi:MAG TPA: PD-(D/E)XK nuclease family protein [Acidimicrobiales bacterium]|jgi:putative RecB family exonuclease|nr:PD-(D/E)XK nuclease family protein [Acidimicrobiales bacterium]
MPLELPRTLSPSKVAAFTDCALAFRFATIDHLPEPPSPWATKGTLVHAALERLLLLSPGERTVAAALTCLDSAFSVLRTDPDYVDLRLDAHEEGAFLDDAERLVRQYFHLEDPTTVNPIGIELMLDADICGVRVRGIIDRLELDEHGELVVVDYKTGRAPSLRFENGRLDGVQFYSLLCERNFGRRPARVKLLYLADPLEISTIPSEQSSRAIERKVGAIWTAVERACARDDFRPKPSRLCDYCSFRAYCPAFGGDIAEGVRVAASLRSTATLEHLAPVALAD